MTDYTAEANNAQLIGSIKIYPVPYRSLPILLKESHMLNCRFCNTGLEHVFVDLGHQPPSNSFLTNLDEPEITYPLRVYVCTSCFLVQLPEVKKASDIFNEDYVYYSSQSPANVSHAKEFVDIVVERFNPKSVLEIGSNDGYLLQWFKEKGIDVLGIDPSIKCVDVARKKKIPTISRFFTAELASEIKYETTDIYPPMDFDFICGINCIAHTNDINDFVEGVKIALKPDGVAVFEFPHLLNLVEQNQFDTIYFEHFSYFSFITIREIFASHGLRMFDVQAIPEHGGSLRIYATHIENLTHRLTEIVSSLSIYEQSKERMNHLHFYQGFQYKVNKVKVDLVSFLIEQKRLGKAVVGYGAPAKASTLLNTCGIKSDLLPFIVDRSPYKQGKFMPGSHIRVTDESELREFRPEYVLILSWNLKTEIMEQLSYIREWKAKFVIPIPNLEVI